MNRGIETSKRALIIAGVGTEEVIRNIKFLAANGFRQIIIALTSDISTTLYEVGNGAALGVSVAYITSSPNPVIALMSAKFLLKHEFGFAVVVGHHVFPESMDVRSKFVQFKIVSYGKAAWFSYTPKEGLAEPISGLFFFTEHVFRLISDIYKSKAAVVSLADIIQSYDKDNSLYLEHVSTEVVDVAKPVPYKENNA